MKRIYDTQPIPDTEDELRKLIAYKQKYGWAVSTEIDNYIVFYKEKDYEQTICCKGK